MNIKLNKKLAKSLSKKQLLDVNILYHSFLKEIDNQYEIHGIVPNEKVVDALAHNLALRAVWELDVEA